VESHPSFSMAPDPRLALVSPLADTSQVAHGLRAHGFISKVVHNSTADILLSGLGGGALSFLLMSGSEDGGSGALPAGRSTAIAERASQAAKASRRCTVLWVGADDPSLDALQLQLPPGVSVIGCNSHEEASEFIIACCQRVLSAQGTAAEQLECAQRAAADSAAAHLASLWGMEQHHVDFLLAARSLSSLARVTSEEAWEQLLRDTEGLIDPQLLYVAVDWLQRDGPQL
jgi:hypothetical protein